MFDEAVEIDVDRLTFDELSNLVEGRFLSKDLSDIVRLMKPREARLLVDLYYIIQKARVANNNRVKAMQGEPTAWLELLYKKYHALEKQTFQILARYAGRLKTERPSAEWLLSLYGVGPVLTVGLLSHVDITKAPTVGKLWRFAGLDPTAQEKKGEKRPFNKRLKVLFWKFADVQVRLTGKKNFGRSLYSELYLSRKGLETERNEMGAFRELAEATLKASPSHKQASIYKKGKLPPGRIELRARRWMSKIFASHLHECLYVEQYGTLPPKPYVIQHLGHTEFIEAPNMDVFPKWKALRDEWRRNGKL
jgi:hypothetical protein